MSDQAEHIHQQSHNLIKKLPELILIQFADRGILQMSLFIEKLIHYKKLL